MFEVRLPRFGEGTEDAILVEWLVPVGHRFEGGEPLVSFETAKAVVDVEAPEAGVLRKIIFGPGAEVPVGEVLAICTSTEQESIEDAGIADQAGSVDASSRSEFVNEPDDSGSGSSPLPFAPPGVMRSRILASPAARRLAKELDIDLAKLVGTGANGRIRSADVRRAALRGPISSDSSSPEERVSTLAGARSSVKEVVSGFAPSLESTRPPATDVRVRLRSSQATYALAAIEAWRSVPTTTTFGRSDVTDLDRQQNRYNRMVDSPAVSITSIALRAVATGLKRFPHLNASFDATASELLPWDTIDIGVGMPTYDSVVVPVIRNAGTKSVMDISRELMDLAERVRSGSLEHEQVVGASVTVFDQADFEGQISSPPLLLPNVAAVGLAKARVEPQWRADLENFEPRLILPVTLTYDVRALSGAQAAQFLKWVCDAIAEPFLWTL